MFCSQVEDLQSRLTDKVMVSYWSVHVTSNSIG